MLLIQSDVCVRIYKSSDYYREMREYREEDQGMVYEIIPAGLDSAEDV